MRGIFYAAARTNLSKNKTMTDSVPKDDGLEIAGDELVDADLAADDQEEAAAGEQDSGPDGAERGSDGGGKEEAAEPEGSVEEAGDEMPGDADSELAALQREFDDLNDRHLRLAAEFNNFRRRSEQERLESWTRARADLVADFLDVLDDLHRVAELDLSNATVEAIMEGIDLVEKKFMRVLNDVGVEIIDPVGEPFDPEMMEAMMRVPAESEDADDTVASVFQKGYTLKGILVRPARVGVHKHG